jgi:hypothetical protein
MVFYAQGIEILGMYLLSTIMDIYILSRAFNMNIKMLVAALTDLVIACVAWLLDTNGIFCLPHSWMQLHSLWHISMAAAIWFLYLYYRSERSAYDIYKGTFNMKNNARPIWIENLHKW